MSINIFVQNWPCVHPLQRFHMITIQDVFHALLIMSLCCWPRHLFRKTFALFEQFNFLKRLVSSQIIIITALKSCQLSPFLFVLFLDDIVESKNQENQWPINNVQAVYHAWGRPCYNDRLRFNQYWKLDLC